MSEEILNRNKNINRGFRKLEVWKESIELFVFVKKKLKDLNVTHFISFKVQAQIEDSILSVSSNISEGYCRRSVKENIHFINIALASLGENYSQVFALLGAEGIDKEWFDEYDKRHYSIENKLIKMNKVMILKIDKNDWNNDYILREIVQKYNSEA